VLPESIIIGGGEGPSVGGSMRTVLMTFISLLGMLGVPLLHTAGAEAAAGGVAVSFAFGPLSLRVLLNGLGTKMAV
jgi:hypothetical protein